MKKVFLLPTLLISMCLCSLGQPYQSRHFTIQKLADGVYAAISKNGGYAICNAGIIDLGDATLIVDPFMVPEAAEDLKKVSQLLTGHEVKYVINSHFHNDHIGGNQVFDQACIISTERTRELIAKFQPLEIAEDKTEAPIELERIKNNNVTDMTPHELEENIMWMGYFESMVKYNDSLRIILPDLTFNNQLIIHGTNRTVQLLCYGTAHTESDLFLYLPAEQIAFLGDLLFIQSQPWLRDGDPDKWGKYLDSISMLNLKTVIPGHGSVGTVFDFEPMKLYFENIKTVARAYCKNGKSPINDSTIKAPPPFDEWIFSNFYKPNVISEYNRLCKNKSF